MNLSKGQLRALWCAKRNAAVFAGGGNYVGQGAVISIAAASIRSLITRGLAEQIPSDGFAARLTPAGEKALQKAVPPGGGLLGATARSLILGF